MARAPMVLTYNGSTSNDLAPQRIKARPAILNNPNPQLFDFWQLGPVAPNWSAAGHPPMTLARKP